MKRKLVRMLLVTIVVFALAFMAGPKARAEITGDGEKHVVTVPCGENITSYVEIDGWIDVTGKQDANNQYAIVDNQGQQIFTGWNQPMFQNNNASYYGRMNATSNNIGQQVLTINFTPSGFGATTVQTVLTVNCTGSDELKTVIEALGGKMPNNYTLDTDDVYKTVEGLTGEQLEAIIDAEDEYNSLVDAEKAIVDNLIAENLYISMSDLLDYAESALDDMASDFVKATKLNEEVPENLEDYRARLVNAIGMDDDFNKLSPRAQRKALNKLSNEDNEYNSWDEVKERCKKNINLVDAKLFLNRYVDYNNGNLNEDLILLGEDTWNNLSEEAKSIINEVLKGTEGIEKTYPELLLRAKANKFINDNLVTDDGNVIVESNNSNYKKVLEAKDAYDALSDDVKEEVNRILTQIGNTTYPELLDYAQKLEPTPKTGDMAVAMIVVSVISILGFAVTFIKRK